MIEVAIIGATASGKSALALEVAVRLNAYIFSIDSLSIYKEINIVAAKPSKDELSLIKHFGIDVLYPNEHVSVNNFITLYRDAKNRAKESRKNLVIVGGSGFYLKRLIDGLSELPKISIENSVKVQQLMLNTKDAYEALRKIDLSYAKQIASNDKYRIEKALLIYNQTSLSPTNYFAAHLPTPIIEQIDIFNVTVDRATLRERIIKRTKNMFKNGLIDEVAALEQKYGRRPNSMKAIGIKETLEYFDGKMNKSELFEAVVTHTNQLAKRQRTFNNSQFEKTVDGSPEELLSEIESDFNSKIKQRLQ